MGNRVLHSWEVDINADRSKWGTGFLELRGMGTDSIVYDKPKDRKIIKQVNSLVEWSLGSRNWIVCICKSPSYMRVVFDYVLASYVFTTLDRAIAVDVDDLIEAVDEPKGPKRDIIEHADLLLVNHCDSDNGPFKWKRGAVANIFYRRKTKRLATIIVLFVRTLPKKMDSTEALNLASGLVDVFGAGVHELFTSGDSKRVVIRPGEEGRK